MRPRALGLAGVLVLAGCSGGKERERARPSIDAADAPGETGDAGAPGLDGSSDGFAADVADATDVREASTPPPTAEGGPDVEAGMSGTDATVDAPSEAQADASAACAPFGAPGVCIDTSACAAEADHSSYPGYCPGPANIECCIVTPNPANNPPPPAGWVLMQQSQVTAAMTAWAVMILNDPTQYPMFSQTMMTFGGLPILAIVEWHPPDFQNSVVHRGVTLYEPAG